jgi:hypothetical protein
VVLAVIAVQFFWIYFDKTFTSQQYYRPKRKPLPVTESSPLSPYYPPFPGQEYTGYSRTFAAKPFPCDTLMKQSDMYSRTGSDEGFLFVKEMQSGSTILAGITARIAERKAKELHPTILRLDGSVANNSQFHQVCTARLMPMRARKLQNRSPKSFAWSVIQEPVERVMHKAYQFARIRNRPMDDVPLATFQDWVLNFENQDFGYYFRSLSIQSKLNPYSIPEYDSMIRQVLDSYDFIGIKERMMESLAVLQLLLGLETADFLFLQSPYVAATRTDDRFSSQTDFYEQWNKGACRDVPSPRLTLDMKKWFHSEEFEAFVQADVLMYKAVNASLDNTIEALGSERVQQVAKQLEWALYKATEKCNQVNFPCSVDGKLVTATDCYFSDVGCGHTCLDEVGESLAKDLHFQALAKAS